MEINTTDGLSADPVGVAIRSLRTMATGGRSDFDAVFHPDAVNRENKVQPPSSRVPGPAGFHSTALWLRAAFAGLHYEIHHALTDGDLVAVNSTMNGRHVAQFVLYRDDGEVDTAFPPPARASQWPKHIGFDYKTARSSSTGRSATIWGRPSNSAGYHQLRRIWSGWRWQSFGPSAETAEGLHHRLKPRELKRRSSEFTALEGLEQEHQTPGRLPGRVDPIGRCPLIGICHRPTIPLYRLALARTELIRSVSGRGGGYQSPDLCRREGSDLALSGCAARRHSPLRLPPLTGGCVPHRRGVHWKSHRSPMPLSAPVSRRRRVFTPRSGGPS